MYSCYRMFRKWQSIAQISEINLENEELFIMGLSDTQVFIALAIALLPGILALRLSTELYKS